jgi:hypothetical protein
MQHCAQGRRSLCRRRRWTAVVQPLWIGASPQMNATIRTPGRRGYAAASALSALALLVSSPVGDARQPALMGASLSPVATCEGTTCWLPVTLRVRRPTSLVVLAQKRRSTFRIPAGLSRKLIPLRPSKARVLVTLMVDGKFSGSYRVTVAAGGPAERTPGDGAPTPTPTPGPAAATPDEPGLPAFRAILAIPSDQTTDEPRRRTAIIRTIEVVNRWYAGQTVQGAYPRWVHSSDPALGPVGRPAVVTVRLPHTAAEFTGPGALALLTNDVNAAAPPTNQVNVVWIDAGAGNVCGITGTIVAFWEATCDIHPAANSVWPFDATYLLGHELAHAFSGSPGCQGPHTDGTGHTNDDPRDIIYSGPLPRVWNQLTLDPGRDDYYPGGPGCDSAVSPLWTTAGTPLAPLP